MSFVTFWFEDPPKPDIPIKPWRTLIDLRVLMFRLLYALIVDIFILKYTEGDA